jgi:hypothetical protein
MEADRIVVGGGLFGVFSAIVLADAGHDVLIVEQDDRIMARASHVNQARLHTGLHYPRSLLTATEALRSYRQFRSTFPSAVCDFNAIYAIASRNSRTSPEAFRRFANRLGLPVREIRSEQYFRSGSTGCVFEVEEPTFDAAKLASLLKREIALRPRIDVRLNTRVIGGLVEPSGVTLHTDCAQYLKSKKLILCAYAGTNGLRSALKLAPLDLSFELTEVLLGNAHSTMQGVGITVMDGPFWSMMPFGNTGLHSLTSVGFTPMLRSHGLASFPCQQHVARCTPEALEPCNSCAALPRSNEPHHLQQAKAFLLEPDPFEPLKRLVTVKTVLRAAEVDDSRPTLVHQEKTLPVATVFSGKINTVFDLEAQLS